MIAERLIFPCSKLAITRVWRTTTLAEELSVQDADVDELYDAMDWLLSRQSAIDKNWQKYTSEGRKCTRSFATLWFYCQHTGIASRPSEIGVVF